MALYFGPNAPFTGRGQKLPRQEDDRLIRNDLLQLLLTAPGERVMRPTFGAGIRNFLFEQMDDAGISSLDSNIRNAISQFEKRVTVTDIKMNRDETNSLLGIKIYGYFNFGINPSEADLLLEISPKRLT